MTELSANRYIKVLGGDVRSHKYPVDSDVYARHIYKGQPIMSDGAGGAIPYTGSITVAATDVFLGIAVEEVNLAAGVAGTVEVYDYETVVGFPDTVMGLDDLGKSVYFDTSDTLTLTAGDNLEIGKIVEVADGFTFVELHAPQISTGA